jgi:hypothetical protein
MIFDLSFYGNALGQVMLIRIVFVRSEVGYFYSALQYLNNFISGVQIISGVGDVCLCVHACLFVCVWMCVCVRERDRERERERES